MKRLVAVLLVLVGTVSMSFAAGRCRTHGAFTGDSCPGCLCKATEKVIENVPQDQQSKDQLKSWYFDNCR